MSGEPGGTCVEVNGLKMYYEIHGTGSPLVAVLPGTTHIGLIGRADWLAPMIGEFPDAP